MSARTRDWPARLAIDPTAFIAPGAVVVGEVSLGARSSVWFNTVVRGDTAPISVGAETNLQDNTVVHVDEGMPALIGTRVTVGHRAIIHGCVIEDECLIGMGSIVLSGARVGRGSLIGAGSLVREGMDIPPGSLVLGSPAKIRGPVDESHREDIERGTHHYVELSRSYRARGFALPLPDPESADGRLARERGPMSWLEWGRLLAALAEGPARAESRAATADDARWRGAPAAGSWSGIEVLCHLRDADRDVHVPRLTRMLAEVMPEIPDVDMGGWDAEREYRGQNAGRVLEEWRAARGELLRRLAPLGPREWTRIGVHSVRGACSVGEMVRDWVEHDLGHLRQLERALGDGA